MRFRSSLSNLIGHFLDLILVLIDDNTAATSSKAILKMLQ